MAGSYQFVKGGDDDDDDARAQSNFSINQGVIHVYCLDINLISMFM